MRNWSVKARQYLLKHNARKSQKNGNYLTNTMNGDGISLRRLPSKSSLTGGSSRRQKKNENGWKIQLMKSLLNMTPAGTSTL
jgi:hypothetical protein